MVRKYRVISKFKTVHGYAENGKNVVFAISKWAFKMICLLSTLILIVRGINRYLEDNDVTKIDTPTYKDDDIDIFPAMSLCFDQRFEDTTFERLGFNVTGSNYVKFLIGHHFDKARLDVKYDDVTTLI